MNRTDKNTNKNAHEEPNLKIIAYQSDKKGKVNKL